MAKSKHRKKQVADNKKVLEKAKKKCRVQNSNLNRSRRKLQDADKENADRSSYAMQSPSMLESAGGESGNRWWVWMVKWYIRLVPGWPIQCSHTGKLLIMLRSIPCPLST